MSAFDQGLLATAGWQSSGVMSRLQRLLLDSDIPEHHASAHEMYSLEGASNSLMTRQRRLTGPKTPPLRGPNNTSPAACDQHQPAASFHAQNP